MTLRIPPFPYEASATVLMILAYRAVTPPVASKLSPHNTHFWLTFLLNWLELVIIKFFGISFLLRYFHVTMFGIQGLLSTPSPFFKMSRRGGGSDTVGDDFQQNG